MMRLVFSDLRDHAATWIGAFLVAVGCGYIGGWAVSILTTTETYRNLETLVWTMVAFSSFAAAVVLVSAANLTGVCAAAIVPLCGRSRTSAREA